MIGTKLAQAVASVVHRDRQVRDEIQRTLTLHEGSPLEAERQELEWSIHVLMRPKPHVALPKLEQPSDGSFQSAVLPRTSQPICRQETAPEHLRLCNLRFPLVGSVIAGLPQ